MLSHEFVAAKISEDGHILKNQYVNSKTKLEIWCPKCEKNFTQTWSNFRNGHRCRFCASKSRGSTRKHTIEKVKKEFEESGWQVLSDCYENNRTKLECICPKGHLTTKAYDDFKSGKGCWECKSEDASTRYRISENKANEIAKKARMKILKHSYKNVKTKIPLECLTCGFQFENNLDSLKWKKVGCPKCKCSHGERQLLNYFEKRPEFAFRQEYKFMDNPEDELEGCKDIKYLPFDMWIEPEDGLEMIIEIDGIQHFEPVGMFGGQKAVERQKRIDIKKSVYCCNYGIPLLRISYNDIDNMEEIIDHFISTFRYKYSRDAIMYSNRKDYTDLMAAVKAELQKN